MTNESLLQQEGEFAREGIQLIEVDLPAVEFQIFTPSGYVLILTDMLLLEDRLVLDQLHVTGKGLNLALIRRVARVLGKGRDVVEVIIQGANRSSGANRGSSPTPIRVKVNS